jgi:hypothetical protein
MTPADTNSLAPWRQSPDEYHTALETPYKTRTYEVRPAAGIQPGYHPGANAANEPDQRRKFMPIGL